MQQQQSGRESCHARYTYTILNTRRHRQRQPSNKHYYLQLITLSLNQNHLLNLHCVSKKHPRHDCNLKKDYPILIIFGTNIPDTTDHQMTVRWRGNWAVICSPVASGIFVTKSIKSGNHSSSYNRKCRGCFSETQWKSTPRNCGSISWSKLPSKCKWPVSVSRPTSRKNFTKIHSQLAQWYTAKCLFMP